MRIAPLTGKYYGTVIEEDVGSGALAGLTFTLWKNTGNPSDRQLAKWGLTREQWDTNVLVDNGCGWSYHVRDGDYTSDGHYESKETFEFAQRICAIANGHQISASLVAYIVQLEPHVWLCDEVQGDPGRTLVEESATRYQTLRDAENAIDRAKKYRVWHNHAIIPVYDTKKE